MRIALIACVLAATGCGKDIGDSCIVNSDCDPNGTRYCDTSSPEGYCTVQGCDVDTCPDDSKCVRFFTGTFENRLCQNNADCSSLDELCSNTGHCVPRSSEVRYCMAPCSDNSDCRDKYECRDADLQKSHGGEPIDKGKDPVKFCAPAP